MSVDVVKSTFTHCTKYFIILLHTKGSLFNSFSFLF